MKSFQDKVAAITGAASGIGRELALELARRGCHLALSDINETELQRTAELADDRVRVTQTVLNVAHRDAIYAWAAQAAEAHGHVNLIFNNAGVALGASIEGATDEDLHWIMDINFWGVVHGTRAFLPLLRASGEGHVINISSVFGLIAVPTQGAYNASKFAVRGFTEALRQELDLTRAPVSASCVHPGGIKTNIARAARFHESLQDMTHQSEEVSKARFEKLFMTPPSAAAQAILRGVQRNARRILIGPDARLIDWMARLLPSGYQRPVTAAARRTAR